MTDRTSSSVGGGYPHSRNACWSDRPMPREESLRVPSRSSSTCVRRSISGGEVVMERQRSIRSASVPTAMIAGVGGAITVAARRRSRTSPRCPKCDIATCVRPPERRWRMPFRECDASASPQPEPARWCRISAPVLVIGLQEYRTRFVIHRRSKSSTVIAHAARRARKPLPSWRRVAGATMQAGRSGLIRDWSPEPDEGRRINRGSTTRRISDRGGTGESAARSARAGC